MGTSKPNGIYKDITKLSMTEGDSKLSLQDIFLHIFLFIL
jgi:hypothetical protein